MEPMSGVSPDGVLLDGEPPDVAYSFGLGDGDITTWHSPADLDLDGDGAFDAVALDFDGDGRIDDAMWDSDLDGVADTVRLDVAALGGDGAERWFTDPPVLGTWGTQVAPEPVSPLPPDTTRADGAPPEQELAPAADGPGAPASVDAGDPSVSDAPAPATVSLDAAGAPVVLVDADDDGRMDTRLGDYDGDGYLDSAGPLGEPNTVGADHAS